MSQSGVCRLEARPLRRGLLVGCGAWRETGLRLRSATRREQRKRKGTCKCTCEKMGGEDFGGIFFVLFFPSLRILYSSVVAGSGLHVYSVPTEAITFLGLGEGDR
jgi:hypothetical protein